MKIATITYHRADNYGAVLQAFALCHYLRKQGYDSEIIDYWPKHHADVYRVWPWNRADLTCIPIWKKPFILLKMVCCSYRRLIRKKKFDKFRKVFTTVAACPRKYDAVFYGSDTIWNKWNLNNSFEGFDDVYWGNSYVDAMCRFSYAPSMGNVICDKDTIGYCKRMLKNFLKISVREVYLKQKLEEWGFQNVSTVIDPTFLLSSKTWRELGNKRIIREEYVVCYNLEQSVVISNIVSSIEKKGKMRVIYLTATANNKKRRCVFDTAGPIEFLSLFNYASYIYTSSFHGVAFSLIFEKQFVFHTTVETERISSLLESCGLSDRFISSSKNISQLKNIDYQKAKRMLDEQKKVSYGFIDDCIHLISINDANL